MQDENGKVYEATKRLEAAPSAPQIEERKEEKGQLQIEGPKPSENTDHFLGSADGNAITPSKEPVAEREKGQGPPTPQDAFKGD